MVTANGTCSSVTVEAKKSNENSSRRLALLKRMGLFSPDTRGARIIRACTHRDLRGAYRLVHDTFVETGYILPHRSRMRVRLFEATEDMATYVAKFGEEVVGVQSIVTDSPELGLPSDQAFRAEIDALRATGAKVYEATNQAVAPQFRKSGVPTELIRVALAHAFGLNCHEVITTVSPGHARFYEFIGFRAISGVRSYSAKIDDPVIVLSINTVEYRNRHVEGDTDELAIRDFSLHGNPYLRYVRSWDFLAKRLFRDSAMLHDLFVQEARLLEECSDADREYLFGRWGERAFAAALGIDLAPQAA